MHPERLGPYRIMDVLGRGGLGVVYRAFDERTEDEVAVKLLVGASTDGTNRSGQRFIREFTALAELDHPNVVRVIEAGISGDMPYFAMELVDGLDIKRHLELYSKGHPSFSESLSLDVPTSSVSNLRAFAGSRSRGPSFTTSGSAAHEVGLDDDENPGEDASGEIEDDESFDVNDWLAEPDSDVLLGRDVTESSGVIGAIGPAPSIDLPFESMLEDTMPFDIPEEAPANLELNEPMRMIRVRELIIQICNSLAYIHSRGLVHRDLKPSNILVDSDGDARLMDFGLCKALADLSDVTDSGQVVGTYRYMSPEQACGEPLDARSDLYSLGVVIYELLAGRPPFLAKNPLQLWEELLEREPPPLVHLNPAVDQRLAQVVHALLRKDPSSRLQTAEEVLEAVLE